MNLSETEKVVERVMTLYPLARDDNFALISAVYKTLLGKDFCTQKNFLEMMEWLYYNHTNEKLPVISTIIRVKSTVQNRRADLRGANWEKNRKNSQKIKEDLGYGKQSD